MKKDEIFFAPEGYNGVQLTSTSCNYIANMAKELYQSAEATLDAMRFYTTTVKLLGSSETTLLQEGVKTVSDIKETMKYIASLRSLISWCREALKAKERLIKEANGTSFSDYGIEVPERPVREDFITADDVIADMSIKQRNQYYYLEAFCATIGQYIHPDGKYAQERDRLQKIIHEPREIQGSGRDTLVYARVASLPVAEVEDTFMDLQKTYREYQAELNSVKHQIETEVQKDTAAKSVAYEKEMSKYRTLMEVADAELSVKKQEAINKASNLKIIIPESLQTTYEKVASLGKKK